MAVSPLDKRHGRRYSWYQVIAESGELYDGLHANRNCYRRRSHLVRLRDYGGKYETKTGSHGCGERSDLPD
jgi:hypothetical protein